MIPFGIVAYGFVGQPFSKQLYSWSYAGLEESIHAQMDPVLKIEKSPVLVV